MAGGRVYSPSPHREDAKPFELLLGLVQFRRRDAVLPKVLCTRADRRNMELAPDINPGCMGVDQGHFQLGLGNVCRFAFLFEHDHNF